jgi:hypothetical protein
LPKGVLAEGILHKSCVVSRLNIGNFEWKFAIYISDNIWLMLTVKAPWRSIEYKH